jgi:hypothetical protein
LRVVSALRSPADDPSERKATSPKVVPAMTLIAMRIADRRTGPRPEITADSASLSPARAGLLVILGY